MGSMTDQLLGIPSPLALGFIAVLVFGEAALFVGFVLPGETAVLLGGVLASTGAVRLPTLLLVVFAAAVLGDSVGYEVGRHFGPRLLRVRPLRNHQQRIDGARAALRERGGVAVFFGRFTAFLRAAMPGLAGISHMSYPRFLAYNAAGGLVWGAGVALVGYFAGASYARIEQWLGPSSAVLVAAFLATALVLWYRRRRHHQDDGPAAARDDQATTSIHEHPASDGE